MNARVVILASLATLSLAACGRAGFPAARQAQAGTEAPDPGYRVAPQLGVVSKAADGAVSLSGRALPSSHVRMVSPAGALIETQADGSGAWTALLGPVSEPTLYRLAEEAGGRRVEAEGLVAVLPGAPTVALLRAGAGAEVAEVKDAGKQPPRILAVDFDMAGGAVVSGRAQGGTPVQVLVDGQPAVPGAAGPDGRFSLTLPKPLPTGRHTVQVQTAQATVGAEIVVSPPAPPKDAPYQARREASGWRVDWITPGGGPQTTLLLAG